MNTSQYNRLFFAPTANFLSFFKEATTLVFCGVKVFERHALLLVINGWGVNESGTSQSVKRTLSSS